MRDPLLLRESLVKPCAWCTETKELPVTDIEQEQRKTLFTSPLLVKKAPYVLR